MIAVIVFIVFDSVAIYTWEANNNLNILHIIAGTV